MKIFANKFNSNFLRNVLPPAEQEVVDVKAAIAYGSDSETLLAHCIENSYRLDIWMRYDHTVPVAPSLLRKLLKANSKNVFCYLVPDVHHAKLIWWRGYGVYIGSANLTDRAWVANFEAGIFLREEELSAGDSMEEIRSLFDVLESLEQAFPLTEEIILEQEDIYSDRQDTLSRVEEKAKARRAKPVWQGPVAATQKLSQIQRRRNKFIQEWESTLTILRSIADQINEYGPTWMPEKTPTAWQADQFLHAYYYNMVADGPSHPFNKFHERNKGDPKSALVNALEWWASLSAAPSNEDVNLTDRAPTIRRLLAQKAIRRIDRNTLAEVLAANHSTVDHASKIPAEYLGRPHCSKIALDERVKLLADLLMTKTNRNGESFPDLLEYVLYGGNWQQTPDRIFDAANSADRSFDRIGLNQLAELVGWSLPERFPPRNGRTSKALRALGYDVQIY